jgi:hypothetical protein
VQRIERVEKGGDGVMKLVFQIGEALNIVDGGIKRGKESWRSGLLCLCCLMWF